MLVSRRWSLSSISQYWWHTRVNFFFLFLRSCSESFPQNFLVFLPLRKPVLQMIDNTLNVESPRANATTYYQFRSDIQLSVQSNLGLHRFSFTLLCDWSRKLALLFQPIRRNIKSNHGLVVRVFPRFRRFSRFYFEFSLALKCIFLPADWLLGLLWFWVYDTQSKRP